MSNPKDVAAAVVAAEQLSTEALEAVARAKNLTPLGERSASPPGGRRTVTRPPPHATLEPGRH